MIVRSAVEKIFVDSNILVYNLDSREVEKQKTARRVLEEIQNTQKPVISTQVLQEVYNAITTKLKIEPLAAKDVLYSLRDMEIVQLDFDIIQQGIDISILSKISFWDGLIIAAASSANCGTVLSEDMNHGQIIRGVRVVNPFMCYTRV
ncbi:PIN domain-containing protein [Treponema primitia]|uniref:PIN domain-containing protein n=1 Tax=Treponema primitia TaxID=88058 RepID=UPI00397F20C3